MRLTSSYGFMLGRPADQCSDFASHRKGSKLNGLRKKHERQITRPGYGFAESSESEKPDIQPSGESGKTLDNGVVSAIFAYLPMS